MEEKKINNISSVCVYCASSTKIPSVYFDAAKELGRLLGERKLRVVNGAGKRFFVQRKAAEKSMLVFTKININTMNMYIARRYYHVYSRMSLCRG